MTMTNKMVECSQFFYLIHEEKKSAVRFLNKYKTIKCPSIEGRLLNYLSALNKPEEPSE